MKTFINTIKNGIRPAAVLLLLVAQSCSNYYKVANAPKDALTPEHVIEANPNSFFILRTDGQAYSMNNIALSQNNRSLTCTLDTLPDWHKLHLHKGRGGQMRYKKNEIEAAVLNEVHFYVSQNKIAVPDSNYTLALNKVQKIEVLEKDVKRTKKSYMIGAVCITAGVAVVALVIAAASVSSGLSNMTYSIPFQ